MIFLPPIVVAAEAGVEDGDRGYGGRDGESARRSTSCRLSRGGSALIDSAGGERASVRRRRQGMPRLGGAGRQN